MYLQENLLQGRLGEDEHASTLGTGLIGSQALGTEFYLSGTLLARDIQDALVLQCQHCL